MAYQVHNTRETSSHNVLYELDLKISLSARVLTQPAVHTFESKMAKERDKEALASYTL